jgi:DnaJ-class molecular chaperone
MGSIVTVYGGLLGYFTYISMPPNLYKLSQEAYSTLGVSRSTTVEEAWSSYRKLSDRLSPDRNSSPDAASQFIAMQEIYTVLSSPTNRAAYEAYGTGQVISSDAEAFTSCE